ncbi:hypothetical protein ACVXPB_18885, partial [Acinetobacter baumannii]
HTCRAARETEEQPHKLLPLHETPTGRNYQSVRVNKPFSYQEIQRIKEDLGDYLEDPEKYIRAFKGVTLLYDLTWKDVMYILIRKRLINSHGLIISPSGCFIKRQQLVWLFLSLSGCSAHMIPGIDWRNLLFFISLSPVLHLI